MSNGESLDGAIEKKLKRIGADNACTEAESDKLWQLTRDLSAIEKGIGRELEIGELIPALEEWYRLSKQFLDPAQSRDDYLAELAGGLGKVRYATGEGDTLNKAFAAVSEFPASELPFVRQAPNAPESWRRVLALHRELSRGSKRKNKTYFLSYRDAAKAHNGLTHQTAYHITLVLRRVKAIEIVSKGKASPNGGKAAEFRYLLPDTSAAG